MWAVREASPREASHRIADSRCLICAGGPYTTIEPQPLVRLREPPSSLFSGLVRYTSLFLFFIGRGKKCGNVAVHFRRRPDFYTSSNVPSVLSFFRSFVRSALKISSPGSGQSGAVRMQVSSQQLLLVSGCETDQKPVSSAPASCGAIHNPASLF